MASGKYPIFNKNKNPFNRNTRVSSTTTIAKKGSVMFDENYAGIGYGSTTSDSGYYDVENGSEYYAIENGQRYYNDPTGTQKHIFHVNYIQNTQLFVTSSQNK